MPQAAGAEVQANSRSKLDLAAILRTPDWPTYSAQSQRIVYGQLAALLELHRRNLWERAGDLWMARLLVENTCISMPDLDLRALVLLVVDEAALVWPLVRESVNTFRMDMTVSELSWVCVFSLDEVQVSVTDLGEMWSFPRGGSSWSSQWLGRQVDSRGRARDSLVI